jgi:predicted nucleic acid-binding protein
MSLVVADTGPLRYLIAIDAIGHLPRLYPQVLVPPAVVAELRHAHAPLVVRQWAQTLPAWIEIQRPNLPHDPQRLDPGEAEALGLALQIRASVVLLDEMEARREAVRLGLSITGTVGILERMAERGLLNLEEAFSRLTATNYRIDRNYLDDALKRARLHGRSREP